MLVTRLRHTATPSSLLLAGFVVGALVAGLVIPFTVNYDDEGASTFAASGSPEGGAGTAGPDGNPTAGSTPSGDASTAANAGDSSIPVGAPGIGGGAGSAAPGTGSVSQRGVTDTQILVGIPIPDTSDFGSLGGVDAASLPDEQEIWQVFIDELNRAPINGRKVKPVYVPYNALDNADTLRACAVLTEDNKVFAVLAFTFFGDAATCVSVQHKTLMFDITGYKDEAYRKSDGRLFSQYFNQTRVNRIWPMELDRLGYLTNKKLGVVTAKIGDDNVPVEEALLPTLRQLHRDVAHVTTLDADIGVAQSQIPLEVAQMRQKGVQAVFHGTNVLYLARFSQEADRQGWYPTYFVSEHAGAMGTFTASTYPTTFQAVGITGQRYGEELTGAPEPTRDAWCRSTYERATGKKYARGSANYQLVLQICSVVSDMFAPGLRGAGPALTTEAFSAAWQRLGRLDIAFSGPGLAGPGKFDAMHEVRTVRFKKDCTCWEPIDNFRAPSA